MQKNNVKSIGKTVSTWGLIGIIGLVGLVSSNGCAYWYSIHPGEETYRKIAEKRKKEAERRDNEAWRDAKVINPYQKEGVLYFSKQGYNCRYAVNLMTFRGAKLCPGSNGWKEHEIPNNSEILQIAANINNNTQSQRNSDDVMNRAAGNMMGNLSTQGWLNFLSKYGR